MSVYHKIQTVYLRDPETNSKRLLEGQYAEPEFYYLAQNEWSFQEKIDGTNIRVTITNDVSFAGKTDNAAIPTPLVKRLQERFLAQEDRLHQTFANENAVLYGEGYGARIQKGGGNYRQDQDFVLFDVKIIKRESGQEWWLRREDVEDVAAKLGLDVAPVIGKGTLPEMVEMTRTGFDSIWGPFKAEGIVARPKVELQTRAGQRIITKIKHRDFT